MPDTKLRDISLDCLRTFASKGRPSISEMTPYDHLKSLQWCRFDNKGDPTRATRYAWILYGDDLPTHLEGNPSNDEIWKSLGHRYRDLQKYVHCSDTSGSDAKIIDGCLRAIQVSLEEYLEAGIDRLKQRDTSS